jgi:hypothetical protein
MIGVGMQPQVNATRARDEQAFSLKLPSASGSGHSSSLSGCRGSDASRFEGFVPQGPSGCAQAPDATSEREGGQRALVRRWQASPQSWPGAMGPKPNEPGCKIPGQILAEFGISTHTTALTWQTHHT